MPPAPETKLSPEQIQRIVEESAVPSAVASSLALDATKVFGSCAGAALVADTAAGKGRARGNAQAPRSLLARAHMASQGTVSCVSRADHSSQLAPWFLF